MALSRAARERLMLDDARARMARSVNEAKELATQGASARGIPYDDSLYDYHWARSIAGEPENHTRTYRATPDSWRWIIVPRDERPDGTRGTRTVRAMRAIGNAPGSDTLGTVKVTTRDGATRIAQGDEFRPDAVRNTGTTTTTNVTRANEVSRMTPSARDAAAMADGSA